MTARQILHESGVRAVTIVEIASRLNISRQSIYSHFHTVEEILDSVYQRIFDENYTSAEPLDANDFMGGAILRLRSLFEMPPEDFTVVSLAFHASSNSDPNMWKLHQNLYEIAEVNWIAPFVEAGVDRVSAVSGVYAIFGAAVMLRELVDNGQLTYHDAHSELERMIRALLQPPIRSSDSDQLDSSMEMSGAAET